MHDTIVRQLAAAARSAGLPVKVEPPSLAPVGESQVRTDLAVAGAMSNGATMHVDVRTYGVSHPAAVELEAALPGIVADRVERQKIVKHGEVIRAHNPRDRFFPFAINEHGALGPHAVEFLASISCHAQSPVAHYTYYRRALAVTAARFTHAMYHGRLPKFAGRTTAHSATRSASEMAHQVHTEPIDDDDILPHTTAELEFDAEDETGLAVDAMLREHDDDDRTLDPAAEGARSGAPTGDPPCAGGCGQCAGVDAGPNICGRCATQSAAAMGGGGVLGGDRDRGDSRAVVVGSGAEPHVPPPPDGVW